MTEFHEFGAFAEDDDLEEESSKGSEWTFLKSAMVS